MTGQNTNNLSDAIRNLIVCDTQFGWTGETTLKLPELLDLQARGWLIEGDDNCEFSLTDEGQAVVARAVQQRAPGELAEQQGVAEALQLADQWRHVFDGDGGHDAAGANKNTLRRFIQAIDALAATGKQQVGEVQGGALVASLVQVMNAEYDGLGRLPADVLGVLNMAAEALAARQPGAQEPVEMSPEFTDTARAAIAWVLWHHQGGSSPVGQPLRFSLGMGQHDRMTDHQIAEAKRFAEWAGATTEGFHRHKVTQGIDLGQQDAERYRFLRSKLATSDLAIILSRKGNEVDSADYVDSETDKVMRNG